MKIRRFPPHFIVFTSMLAAAGCSAFAAGADPSRGVPEAAWDRDAGANVGVDPVLDHAELRAESTGLRDPAEPADTIRYAPGALLDVWLHDKARDLRSQTSERSLGTAVVRGDFFRYTTVNFDPDLRGLWGQPLLLKWSAFLEVPEAEKGVHVFVSELTKERYNGAMRVRTMVRINEQTVFERDLRVFLTNSIFETQSRPIALPPGFHKLEVLLAVDNQLDLPPATQLGTYLKIRPPGQMTAAPLDPSRVWHRVP